MHVAHHDRIVDLDREVLVIAEVGNNHEGDVGRAREMIHRAAEAGARAVKFQTFRTEQFVSPHEPARFDQLSAFELSFGEFEQLACVAEQANIMFLSTPLDLCSAAFLTPLVPAFKIASSDNDFFPLLDQVARTGKPILLSTGLATMSGVGRAKTFIEDIWAQEGHADPAASYVCALHCVTAYPVPPEQANLRAIRTLATGLGCTVGYSDHTIGIEAAVLSVALGARIVEKHFTLDKQRSSFRDHQLSADPTDLAELVERVRACEALLGSGEKVPQPCEQALAPACRRSIVASRKLPAGTVLSWDDLMWVRPAGGLAPGREHLLLDKVLIVELEPGDPIEVSMVRPSDSTGTEAMTWSAQGHRFGQSRAGDRSLARDR